MVNLDLEHIENNIEGYKYLLELSICPNNDLLKEGSAYRLCICDTRDECIEQIKKEIEQYQETNKNNSTDTISNEPYNITRLGSYIKWYYDNDKSKCWWWIFSIFPVPYKNSTE